MDDEPNSLYMLTYVESEASDPYYSEYYLKYTLTEQEMKDYAFLHKDGSDYYIQAVFMNNEISKSKKATVLGETKMNVEAHEEMIDVVKDKKQIKEYYDYTKLDILLKNFDSKKNELTVMVYPRLSNNTSMVKTDKLFDYPLVPYLSHLKINNNVFYGTDNIFSFDMDTNRIVESPKVTFYHSQDTILGNIYTKDLRTSL